MAVRDNPWPLIAMRMTRSAHRPGQIVAVREQLVAQPREGASVDSLEELVTRRFDALLRVAVLVCREPADAEDAVQIALERAWRHARDLREPARAEAWLHRIVVREAIRLEQRRRGVLARWFSKPLENAVEPRADTGLDLALEEALNDLTVELRAALVLHHYVGYSVEETAGLLGVRLETARSRLRVARSRMRDALGGSANEA